MQHASALVYKEYRPHVIASLNVSVLEAMPAYLESLHFAEGMELLSLSAWPCRLVDDAGTVRGFVMPAIPSEFFLDIKKSSGVQRSAGEFQLLLNGDSFLARRQIPLSDRHRFELLAETARGLAVFHRHGIAVGDLSPKNLLFSLAPDSRVFFIDCDAMHFQGQSVMPQLETPGWEVRAINPAEVLGTEASDRYKLALLALRMWAGDQSTRDPSKLPATVPNDIRRLVSAGLSTKPIDRPPPGKWVQSLLRAASSASTVVPTMSQVTSSSVRVAPSVPVVRHRPVASTRASPPIPKSPLPKSTPPNTAQAQFSPLGHKDRRAGDIRGALWTVGLTVTFFLPWLIGYYLWRPIAAPNVEAIPPLNRLSSAEMAISYWRGGSALLLAGFSLYLLRPPRGIRSNCGPIGIFGLIAAAILALIVAPNAFDRQARATAHQYEMNPPTDESLGEYCSRWIWNDTTGPAATFVVSGKQGDGRTPCNRLTGYRGPQTEWSRFAPFGAEVTDVATYGQGVAVLALFVRDQTSEWSGVTLHALNVRTGRVVWEHRCPPFGSLWARYWFYGANSDQESYGLVDESNVPPFAGGTREYVQLSCNYEGNSTSIAIFFNPRTGRTLQQTRFERE